MEVQLKPNTIKSISPNPSSDKVVIYYKINNGSSAYLNIVSFYRSSTSSNYIINMEENEISIDLNTYPNGFYTVSLITDGIVNESKTLVKQ